MNKGEIDAKDNISNNKEIYVANFNRNHIYCD